MKDQLLSLAGKIREGNSLRADVATEIRHELHRLATFFERNGDNETAERLDFIIKQNKEIMDQNKAINDALDGLAGVVTEGVKELAAAATASGGMTDDQAQAIVDRITTATNSLKSAETPVVSDAAAQ